MRIIFSSYDDIKNPYYAGGGAWAIHEVALRLTKKFQVTVLTGNYPSAVQEETIDGVKYERLGPVFCGPHIGQLIFHFLILVQVICRSFDVWFESFTPPFSTSLLPLFTRKPVIGVAHMLSGQDMRRKYFFPFDWIERVGLRAYSHCIATTEHFRRKIIAINRHANVTVVPNGVAVDALYATKKTPEYILYFGRIEMDQKGLDLLLQAYTIIQDTLPLPLVIAGHGTKSEREKLKALITVLKIDDKVRLLGRVSGDKAKKQLFENSFVCVLPSRFETFSMVALEAFASGTPLVAFDIEGLVWIPATAMVKVPPFDATSLARGVTDLWQNKAKWKGLADGGPVFAKRYDWDTIANRYTSLITRIQKV